VDSSYHILRKITPAGVVTTLAGGVGVTGTNDGPGTQARFHSPEGVVLDGAGNVYVADTANHSIRKVSPGGVVTTLAGTPGTSGTSNGTGTAARFNSPYGLAVATNGTIYVADCFNHVIRKITAVGAVTTFAGKMSTSGTNNGSSTSARFNAPVGVAVGSGGTLYVADYWNNEIRKISSSGTVSTLAGFPQSDLLGNPIGGSADGTGSAARFDQPFDVAADLNKGLVYVADSGNQLIRKITSAGVVTTLAGQAVSSGTNNGTGSAARFNIPTGAALDGNGNMYISDYGNQVVRKISPAGVVTSLAGMAGVAGTNNGTGASARFNGPAGVAVDGSGNVYVAEYQNHAIRKITSAGVVTTLAGLVGTFGTRDGVGVAARFNYPQGVAVDRSNYVYVADGGNDCIRKVAPDGTVTTLAGLCGNSGSDDGTNSVARFNSPLGIAVDSASNLFIGDTGNQVVRKITPDGVVSTIGGQAGTSGSTDGSGSEARFNYPEGVAVDANGFVYVTDSSNHTIRKGNPALPDYPVVDVPIASIGNVRHLDVTNLTTTSWSWSIVRYPAAGTAQLSATTVHNPTFNPDATNDFYVIRFQGWGALGRTAIGTVSVGDDMRPQVIIISPAWDQRINNPACTVTGTATDDVELASVQVQLNNGPWLPASGLTNWTAQVTLIQGVNTIRAYAVDNRGQFSATNSVSVVLGGPWLTITPTETNSLVVSWPLPAAGWVLEWTNAVPVVSNIWPRISPPYQTNATQAWIVVPAPTGSAFYRLHKP
jgi:NHL repeat/Bacterial Ig domain